MKLRKEHHGLSAHKGELKPFKFPAGFVLVVDTREQHHVFTRLPPGLVLVSEKLEHGDYSIKGFEDLFTVERKRIPDLYSYCGRERRNTSRKMEKFREMIKAGGWVGLAIEDSEDAVLLGDIMTKVPPEVVRQSLASFRVRYGVHIYFHKDPKCLARWILDSALKFYQVKREVSE